jgi:hypothetical protein
VPSAKVAGEDTAKAMTVTAKDTAKAGGQGREVFLLTATRTITEFQLKEMNAK